MPKTTALACLPRLTFALLMACGVWSPVSVVSVAMASDPVWRCPTAEGAAVAYQATPCRDGGQALPLGPTPSTEDREASARVAEREASLAGHMGRQRVKREKDLPAAHASLSGPVRQVSVGQREEDRIKARKRSKSRDADPSTSRARQRRHDVFRAEVPGRSRKPSGQAQAGAVAASPP